MGTCSCRVTLFITRSIRSNALAWDTAAGGADAGIGVTDAWSLVSTASTLTAAQKLEKVGLSTEELKSLLGL